MEKSTAEIPNAKNSFLGNQSLSSGDLSLTQSKIQASSLPPTRIQVPQFAMPVPSPVLLSQNIWPNHNFLGSSLQGLMPPASNFVNCYNPNAFGFAASSPMSQGGGEYLPNSFCYMQNQEKIDALEGYGFIIFAKSQEGSEKLLKVLQLNKPELTGEIFRRVTGSLNGVPFIHDLMIDHYGCHVFTNLLYSCNQQQLALIVSDVTKDLNLFLKIALNKHGSISIQKLVKLLHKSDLISPVISTLCSEFFRIMTDQIGSYVISHCLCQLPSKLKEPLYEAAIIHCLDLAIHNQGCNSLQSFIDNIQGFHRDELLDLISSNAVFLSQDPFGNFIVQKVLGLGHPIFTEKICRLLKGYYANLSLQRRGCHVVIKCLHSQHMHYAVEDLLSNPNHLLLVARDRNGNYVIQAALKVTKQVGSPLYQRFLTSLQPHLNALRCVYG